MKKNSENFNPCSFVFIMLYLFSMPRNWCVGNQHVMYPAGYIMTLRGRSDDDPTG